LVPTAVWPGKVGTVPTDTVGRLFPLNGTLAAAFTVPPEVLALTVPAPATVTFAPALTVAGVIVIVPPEPGAALLRSERSWLLLDTETVVPVRFPPNNPFVTTPREPRGLFTAIDALVEAFAATDPTRPARPTVLAS
jgi:hypothetical protein